MWSRSEPQLAVRCMGTTPSDHSKPRIGSEFDGFCGVGSGLGPKDIGADRYRLSSDGLGLYRGTEYIDDVDERIDLF
jgi:hypothetical protein